VTFNISKKRVPATGDIVLKDADGSTMKSDKGEVLSVTCYSPASKQWQQASAEMNRKRAERMRKQGGKIEAALESSKEDQVDFLSRITTKQNNFTYGDKSTEDPIREMYNDDGLGFVRDHVFAEVNDWSAFTKGSANSSAST